MTTLIKQFQTKCDDVALVNRRTKWHWLNRSKLETSTSVRHTTEQTGMTIYKHGQALTTPTKWKLMWGNAFCDIAHTEVRLACQISKDPEPGQFMEWQQINGIHGCFFTLGDFSTGNLAGEFQSCSAEPGFPGEGFSFDDRRLNDSTRSLVPAFFSFSLVSMPFSERRDFRETWLLSESTVISLSVI